VSFSSILDEPAVVHVSLVTCAYLLGSIPFSYVVARRFGVSDVRSVGSGNVGASNVLRSAGVTAGVLALLLDVLKGTAAALLAQRVDPGGSLPALAALSVVLGHLYPVWLGFRGGKGVATGVGAFFPLVPVPTVAAVGVFAATVLASRYISLGSIAGALTLPVATFALAGGPWLSAGSAAVAVLIIARHAGNIERLANGTERRLGGRWS
jgi:glycerol-3-phosphate acyltransferase PlsY